MLLADRIPADHRCDGPWCCRGLNLGTAIGLLATIRERQGHIDEAIDLLRHWQITSVNSRDQLADLLARHSRIEELRAYAATDGHEEVVQRLAELLEEHGDVEGAIAAYRGTDGPVAWNPNSAYKLAQLLTWHGRGDETIAVMRAHAHRQPLIVVRVGMSCEAGRRIAGCWHRRPCEGSSAQYPCMPEATCAPALGRMTEGKVTLSVFHSWSYAPKPQLPDQQPVALYRQNAALV